MKASLPQDDNEKHRMILQLINNLRCVECGRLYNAEDFALLRRRENVWLLSARCRHCNELCQVVILLPTAEEIEISELSTDEAQAISELPPISSDDVLDLHLFMQDFDGDFELLFAR
jgi:hypothetical protein